MLVEASAPQGRKREGVGEIFENKAEVLEECPAFGLWRAFTSPRNGFYPPRGLSYDIDARRVGWEEGMGPKKRRSGRLKIGRDFRRDEAHNFE